MRIIQGVEEMAEYQVADLKPAGGIEIYSKTTYKKKIPYIWKPVTKLTL